MSTTKTNQSAPFTRFPSLYHFLAEYLLVLTPEQNNEYNNNIDACDEKICYVMRYLMVMIECSRQAKINSFQNVPIYKTAYMDLDSISTDFKMDFLCLTKLDQYKAVELTRKYIEDLSKFVPKYNNNLFLE